MTRRAAVVMGAMILAIGGCLDPGVWDLFTKPGDPTWLPISGAGGAESVAGAGGAVSSSSAATSASSASSTAATSTASSSSASASTSSVASSSSGGCGTPADCPAPECAAPTCAAGICGTQPEPDGTPCPTGACKAGKCHFVVKCLTPNYGMVVCDGTQHFPDEQVQVDWGNFGGCADGSFAALPCPAGMACHVWRLQGYEGGFCQ